MKPDIDLGVSLKRLMKQKKCCNKLDAARAALRWLREMKGEAK